MFYSQFILAKKGPLGTIWIAAHLERKLRKNQVADTDIGVSVDSILFPEVPIALRLSSHLLLGVVRIYSKKVNYLFDDCSDALLKVKQAFRSAAVDLPPEQSKAPYHSITLPETFDLDDFELPDNDVFQGNFVDHHISTREQITLQDTMDGVAFTSSQFGLDERFGDGDASQIGLDLDEELFMNKEDTAGTSGIFVAMDDDPQTSTTEPSSSKDNEYNEGVLDPPLASNANYFSIQAPSTPGLTEEPNLSNAKEEILVSDDHMDEDQKPCEISVKESGTSLSPLGPSDVGAAEFHSNGNIHFLEEQVDEVAKTLRIESAEFITSGFSQPATVYKHIEANNGQPPENQRVVAADVQSKGCCDVNELVLSGTALPVDEKAIFLEVQGCDSCAGCDKTDPNGFHTCHLLHDGGEEKNTSVDPAVLDTNEAIEHQNSFQSVLNLKNAETSESIIDEKSPGFVTPVLRECKSKVPIDCEEADYVFNSSNNPAQADGPNLVGTSEREDATTLFGVTANVQDVMEPTSKADQVAHGVPSTADSVVGGQPNNLITEENHIEKESNLLLSDFPPPEVLLSMPNMSAGLSDNFFGDSTPAIELLANDGNVTDEKAISGRKRSFTESTLTVQSLNSVESCGGAQSKGTVESVPDDDDLLSSILVGRRSTAFKMKPTPPLPDTIRAKRQRTAVRSVALKRKVLVDDSTVLHGDTIRQQLTDTEDIRRVRKKAPCTKLEVWVLQKQFLEDEIFSEPVFAEMFPVLKSLDNEAFDLSGIHIIREKGNKGASEADISTRSTLGEETEVVGSLVCSAADYSTRTKLGEESESVGTLKPSIAAGDEFQGGRILSETTYEQASNFVVDDSTLLKEIDNEDSEISKQMSSHNIFVENVCSELEDVRSPVGGDSIHSVTLGAEPVSLVGHVPEVNCHSADDTKGYSPLLDKSIDVVISVHTDASRQILDQRCITESATGDASTADIFGSVVRDQGVDIGVSDNVSVAERSDGDQLLYEREGVRTYVSMEQFQDTCSLVVRDSSMLESIAREDKACPSSDQVVDKCGPDEFGIANKDETFGLGLRIDGSCLPSNNVDEHVKLDMSHSVDADLNSHIPKSNEMEGLHYWENDPKMVMDSTPIPSEFIDAVNHAEFGTEAVEHDTDFLNVDDDDVAEDYESDMPNPEERRILDNSGWSSRTRAVANYLQVLFEKESDQVKKVISLDSLLVGKTRKEASRMFFETLVLKTKDYIQAEQGSSFCDIKINPRGKLLKSEF